MAGKGPDDRGDFAGQMSDVRPLRDAPRIEPARSGSRGIGMPNTGRVVRFEFPDPDDPSIGIAKGIQARHLRRLKAGKIPPESEVDLHGLRKGAARSRLRAALSRANAAGERCMLVIHGRGLSSADAPVLREALPTWLAEAPCSAWVLAFCPASSADGGSGASYVLLRRARPDESG